MPNSIALVKKYVDKLDDVYKLASLTDVLETLILSISLDTILKKFET